MPINNQQPLNPSKYFWQFKGSTGKLSRYDKEKESNVEIDPPLRFIVLDELNTIKGFNKALEKGIWANEVRNLHTDDLRVQNVDAQTLTGKYENIKDKLKAAGGKFAKSAYIMVLAEDGKTWEIQNVTWSGASVGAWFDANKKINTSVEAMKWSGIHDEKNGATKYFVPDFEGSQITPEEMEIALELNKTLQEYLDWKLAQSEEPQRESAPASDKPQDVVIEDIDDKPIDLSEIPF